MKKFIAFGKKGKLDKLILLKPGEDFPKAPKKAPRIEMDYGDMYIDLNIKGYGNCDHDKQVGLVYDAVNIKYLEWDNFGSFGDVVQGRIDDSNPRDIRVLLSIGRMECDRPGLAADIFPIVRDIDGNLFFLGIIRKEDPGKGMIAPIGGFRDIERDHMQGAAECLIHESKDEAGFMIGVDPTIRKRLENEPYIREFFASVKLGAINEEVIMKFIGIFNTDEGYNQYTGRKRVYETAGYTCLIKFNAKLDEKTLKDWLKAGDDADDVVAWNLTKRGGPPEFGCGHYLGMYEKSITLF